MKGSDIMKSWDKKTWIYNIIIAILFISTILLVLFFNTPKVTADDNVSMIYFNKTIEELNTKIDSMQLDIDTLETKNIELQDQVEFLTNKVNNQQKQISNNNALINNSMVRIDKIEARETKLYETFRTNTNTQWFYKTMINFKNSQ